jgi:hypothetical protein
MNYVSFYNLVRTEDRTLPWTVRLLYSEATARCHEYTLCEAPPNNGPLRLSGFLTHSLSSKRASTPQQPCVSKPLPSNRRNSDFTIPAFGRHVTTRFQNKDLWKNNKNRTLIFASCCVLQVEILFKTINTIIFYLNNNLLSLSYSHVYFKLCYLSMR